MDALNTDIRGNTQTNVSKIRHIKGLEGSKL